MTAKTTKAGAKILVGARQARAFARGEDVAGAVVHPGVDVAAVRKKTGLTQAKFAETYGLDVAAVRDWEQHRRTPERSAQTLLRVIDAAPETVERAVKRG